MPRSDLAVPGVYVMDGTVADRAAQLAPSARGELEIVDLLERYRADGELRCTRLGRGFVWLDAGTVDGLLEASNFVATIQKRTGYEVACLEEIAWRQGFIDDAALRALAEREVNVARRDYLRGLQSRS